jgi:hypothetical protein
MIITSKRRYFFLFTALAIIASFTGFNLSSCRKADIKVGQQNNEIINNARKWFTEKSTEYPEIWGENKTKLDWDNAIIISTSDEVSYVVTPYKKLVYFMTTSITLSRQVIFRLNSNNEVETVNVLETFSKEYYLMMNKKTLAKKYLDKNFSFFTGSVILYDLAYSILDNPSFKNGIQVGKTEIKLGNSPIYSSAHAIGKSSGVSKTAECYYYFLMEYFSDGTSEIVAYLGSSGCTQQEEGSASSQWPAFNGTINTFSEQNIIDSLQGYPCAQDVLTQMQNCNDQVDTILKNVFGVNGKVNVFFKGDSTLPITVNGRTKSAVYDPATGVMSITIGLNTTTISSAAKELIAKTMLHETIHAYINYYWANYQNGLMDSTTFKTMFPLVWQYKNAGESQHEQMVESYLDVLKDFIRQYSPNYPLSDETIAGIAWNGLTRTSAWHNLGADTAQMLQAYQTAKYGSSVDMYILGMHKCN